MVTLNQLCNKIRKKKLKKNRTPALLKNPFKKGVCIKLFVRSPKKPNSALRKIAKVRLSNNFYKEPINIIYK